MKAVQPRTPDRVAGRRVSHDERTACVDALQHGFEIGQLDQIEMEDRVEAALRAKTSSDLSVLVADLKAEDTSGTRRGQVALGLIATGVAAVVLMMGVHGVAADGSTEPLPEVEACISTGLPATAGCPDTSAEQGQIILDVQASVDAAERAQGYAEGDATGREWAKKAEVAAARTARAERDAQVIVATAPNGELEPGALKVPAKEARQASQDAITAALEVEAADNGSS